MKNLIYLLIGLMLIGACKKKDDTPSPIPIVPPTPSDTTFYTGMDLSYQPFLGNYNFDYKDENGDVIDDLLYWVSNNGVNIVRIRLFHTPTASDPILLASNLESVIQLSKKVKASGNKILLDLHYSDTWADPGKQFTPSAWDGLSFELLSDSLYEYTKKVLLRMNNEGVMPDMVQIGNETNNGFLWDHGKLWIGNDDNNWPDYTILVKRALSAVGYVKQQTGEDIETIVHFAGLENADYFFQKMDEYGVGYDIIGISHYHIWHNKNLDEVKSILSGLATDYGKPILIVETVYPFTLGWNDWTHNFVGEESQLIPGYPATAQGQKSYFENFVQLLKDIPNGKGMGFVYWAPDMVAFDGPESTNGSSMENLSGWDFDNKALPLFEVFRKY